MRLIRAVPLLALSALVLPSGAVAKTYAPGLAADASGGSAMDHYSHLGSRTLRAGVEGHDVRVAQDLLRRAGQKVTIDGEYGPSTVKAVKAWEKVSTRRVDGVLTPADAGALRASAAAPAQVKATADAIDPTDTAATGGADPTAPVPAPVTETPGAKATINADGTATAPASAPQTVKDIIAAGNQIASAPYVYGGGHGSFSATQSGYDCSGSLSFALHGADLLSAPRDSTGLESFGSAGAGQWVTIYANAGHTFLRIAGIRFDTSGANPSRWQTSARSSSGYVVRHPNGL